MRCTALAGALGLICLLLQDSQSFSLDHLFTALIKTLDIELWVAYTCGMGNDYQWNPMAWVIPDPLPLFLHFASPSYSHAYSVSYTVITLASIFVDLRLLPTSLFLISICFSLNATGLLLADDLQPILTS